MSDSVEVGLVPLQFQVDSGAIRMPSGETEKAVLVRVSMFLSQSDARRLKNSLSEALNAPSPDSRLIVSKIPMPPDIKGDL